MKLSAVFAVAAVGLTNWPISVLAVPYKPLSGTTDWSDTSKITINAMVWTGPITPGGPDYKLNGTAKEVYNQILKLNPAFKSEDFGLRSPGARLRARTALSKASQEERELEKRSKMLPPLCDSTPFQYAKTKAVITQYDFLAGLPGRCGVSGGRKGICARMACGDGAGLYLCNDTGNYMEPSCKYLASYVYDIYSNCLAKNINNEAHTKGQLFDTDQYNVVVTAVSYFGERC